MVEETRGRVKKWKGHYYIYVRQADGTEKRFHRAKILGNVAGMKKWEAKAKLRELIATETAKAGEIRPSAAITLESFWAERYRPMKETGWKSSTRAFTIWFIERYIIRVIGQTALGDLDKFRIQMHLNELAGKYSQSVVTKVKHYLKSILEEAVEGGYVEKNPADKVTLPKTGRRPTKRNLTLEEVGELMASMSGRNRLIFRMFLVLGLRSGELFALRRSDRVGNCLRIDESYSRTRELVAPKTNKSEAFVWLPNTLATELDFWLEAKADKRPEAFIFSTGKGRPIMGSDWLDNQLKPAAKAARQKLIDAGQSVPDGFLEKVTVQALRRTCGTQMQHAGTIKDVQAHLRHANPDTTLGVYIQQIPESVRTAVEALDRKLIMKAEFGENLPVN